MEFIFRKPLNPTFNGIKAIVSTQNTTGFWFYCLSIPNKEKRQSGITGSCQNFPFRNVLDARDIDIKVKLYTEI